MSEDDKNMQELAAAWLNASLQRLHGCWKGEQTGADISQRSPVHLREFL
jgi:hypothetical protein